MTTREWLDSHADDDHDEQHGMTSSYTDESTVVMEPVQQVTAADDDLAAFEDPQAAHGGAGEHVARKPHGSRVGLITGLIVFAVLVVLFAGYCVGASWYFKDKVAPGVSFGSTRVLAMDKDELQRTVKQAVQQAKVTVTNKQGESVQASLSDLGVSTDVDATVQQLLYAKKDHWYEVVNPFAKQQINVQGKVDQLALTQYLSKNLIDDSQRVVNASVVYNKDAAKFEVVPSREGEAPVIDNVLTAINAVQADPAVRDTVAMKTKNEPAAIDDQTAQQTADAANARLANELKISNGENKTFTIPAQTVASWIHVTGNIQEKKLDIAYDTDAVKQYLADTLPKELNQDVVTEKNVVDTSGKVLFVDVKGVKGVKVDSVDQTTTDVLHALEQGQPAEIKAAVQTEDFKTESRTVRYDVPDGDPHMVVNLSEQKAYAYKGTTLVKTFNISSGTLQHPSDNGTFFVYLKYESQRMRGGVGADAYDIPGVPWVTYYNDGESFHGAPWNLYGVDHGIPGSHGCAGMYPEDAHWVYDFLPMGSMVQVIGSTPTSAVRPA